MKRIVVNWWTICAMVSFITVFLWHMQTMSSNQENGAISFFWSWSYWSTFLLTWYASMLHVCITFTSFCVLQSSNILHCLERQANFTSNRHFLVNGPKLFKIVCFIMIKPLCSPIVCRWNIPPGSFFWFSGLCLCYESDM